MFSLFGWTPALRRMLRGRMLPCGCAVGVYETWSGDVVQLVDAHAPTCFSKDHAVNAMLGPDVEVRGNDSTTSAELRPRA